MSNKITKDYYLYLSLGLIILSLFIFTLAQPSKNKLSVEATVTKVNMTPDSKPMSCSPIYKYVIDEFIYENMSENKSPNFCSYVSGDKIKVSVSKNDKYKVSTPNNGLINMEKIISLLLLLSGIGMLLNTIYTYRPRKNKAIPTSDQD